MTTSDEKRREAAEREHGRLLLQTFAKRERAENARLRRLLAAAIEQQKAEAAEEDQR